MGKQLVFCKICQRTLRSAFYAHESFDKRAAPVLDIVPVSEERSESILYCSLSNCPWKRACFCMANSLPPTRAGAAPRFLVRIVRGFAYATAAALTRGSEIVMFAKLDKNMTKSAKNRRILQINSPKTVHTNGEPIRLADWYKCE